MLHFGTALVAWSSGQGLFQDFAPGGQMLSAQILGGGGQVEKSAKSVRKHANVGASGGIIPQEYFSFYNP